MAIAGELPVQQAEGGEQRSLLDRLAAERRRVAIRWFRTRDAVGRAVEDRGKVRTWLRTAVDRTDFARRRLFLLWRGRTRRWRPSVWAALLITAALFLVLVFSVLGLAGIAKIPFGVDHQCKENEFACATDAGVVFGVFAVVAGFCWLVLWRMWRMVNSGYVRAARKSPAEAVPTAADVERVVGRNDLCRAIDRDLSDRSTRRPQIVVGGVGAGKTAVLVRLTQWLADRGAVPICVSLREMQEGDDFGTLAKRRFESRTDMRRASEGEADRLWRRLRGDGVVVVLADGLEEALTDVDARETSIRQALDDARRTQLPLVVASRPDDALPTYDAALIELGPIDEEDAVEHILHGRARPGRPRLNLGDLRSIVATAKVAEMPFYLELTQQLYARDLLPDVACDSASEGQRLAVRLRLLDQWHAALIEGQVRPDVSVTRQQRVRAIRGLSALAAAALVHNTLELRFKDFKRSEHVTGEDLTPEGARRSANVGARLRLVDTLRSGVRFRHSIMQAYLGSLWIHAHGLETDSYIQKGLKDGGREFLMALVMACARLNVALSPTVEESVHNGGVPTATRERLESVRDRLLRELDRNHDEDWRVLLLGAAWEIDRMLDGPPVARLAASAHKLWSDPTHGSAKLEEAKGQAIERIAEVNDAAAYKALYEICKDEQRYRVRLAAAQHLAAGGDKAAASLRRQLTLVTTEAERVRDWRTIDRQQARRFCLQGWILPLLLATSSDERPWVKMLLERWVNASDGAALFMEACLAQGLKYEANRIPGAGVKEPHRDALVDHAEGLLERSTYWYTRMTLLHALSLWSLPAGAQPHADMRRRIKRWQNGDEHPFVRAAAELCLEAMDKQDPSPYIWIDEAGIVAKLGQRCTSADARWVSHLWITDALGWVALEPRALRLVGDALLLLNLTDGDDAEDGEGGDGSVRRQIKRLERARKPGLPPCIVHAGDRHCLCTESDEDGRTGPLPGTTCAGACKFFLCPYPPPGRTLRPDFSESFCRRLATLGGRAEWHEASPRKLKEFWRGMERRARAQA